jgi:AbrB family looped-hinge helix DNA binding protein
MGPQGRVVIPARLRRALRLQAGDALIARIDEDRLVLERPQAALGRLQRAFTEAVPPGVSLVDELLADRRTQAREDQTD